VEIVLDLPDDANGEDVPVQAVTDALSSFIVAYAKLIAQLLGTAGASASA
jgi:hypothetical protein